MEQARDKPASASPSSSKTRLRAILPWSLVTLVGGGLTIVTMHLIRIRSTPLSHELPAQAAETVPAHVRGPSNAPVTIEEFGDFECPPCGALSGVLQKIESDSNHRSKLIFRHYPLKMHPGAERAAFAAEAAGFQ